MLLRANGAYRTWLPASLALALMPTAALAAPDKGDTAFLMLSSVLVLLMTIPGLALFYCGLVRTKNAISMLMQVFTIVCLVCVLWMLYGYSLTFTNGGQFNAWIGGFSKAFLRGITPSSEAPTFSNGVYVPEYAYVWFQMTFAAITPALIVGAFAERMKFSALIVFMILWVTFVYFPIAHMVWYWAGPDAIAEAAGAVLQSTGLAKIDAQEHLAAVLRNGGMAYQWGAIDFAGGTVVHTNAGIAALVGALILGPRSGYGREPMPPHSLVLAMVGASLLWVGWFGFNCGSNLEANGTAALAMGNTFGATAAAALAWMFTEWVTKGKPTLLGVTTGTVAGLVAVTPASGFAGPMGALALGAVAGVVCFLFCTSVKNALGYDDSLDVFGRPLHRRYHRRARHRTAGQPASRRNRRCRLCVAARPGGGHLRHGHADAGAVQGRARDAGVVGRRLGHHLPGAGPYNGIAPVVRERAARTRPRRTRRARL